MRTVEDALELSETLVRLVGRFGRRASALVSDMEEPLGAAVGTGIEAVEARDFLRGDDRDPRLAEAIFAVVHEMLRVGGVAEEEIAPRALDALGSGAAYERFAQMIEAQGGSRATLDDLAVDGRRTSAPADRSGFVTGIDAVAIGELARELVAAGGPFAGVRIIARVGTPVRAGEVLAECIGDGVPAAAIAAAFTLGDVPPAARPLVATIVRDAPAVAPSNGLRS